MAAMSNYLQNSLIDSLFRGIPYTAPTTLYIALCLVTPTAASTGSTINEPAGYTRQSISSAPSSWYTTQNTNSTGPSAGTTGATGNIGAVVWTNVNWSGTVVGVCICDAPTGGNVLFYTPVSKEVSVGDVVQLATNNVRISLS